jgi:hypothetical protein
LKIRKRKIKTIAEMHDGETVEERANRDRIENSETDKLNRAFREFNKRQELITRMKTKR